MTTGLLGFPVDCLLGFVALRFARLEVIDGTWGVLERCGEQAVAVTKAGFRVVSYSRGLSGHAALPRLPAFPQRLPTLITKRLKRRNDGCVDSSSKVEHVCFSNFLQTYFHQSDPGTPAAST